MILAGDSDHFLPTESNKLRVGKLYVGNAYLLDSSRPAEVYRRNARNRQSRSRRRCWDNQIGSFGWSG